jgi:rRNA maturation RNase YbeY
MILRRLRMILNQQNRSSVDLGAARDFAERLRKALGLGYRDFNVCFVDDERISALNAAFRGKAYPTDVLSFPWQAGEAPGPGSAAGHATVGAIGVELQSEPANRHGGRKGMAPARWLASLKDSRRSHKRPEPHQLEAELNREFEGFLGDIMISVEAAERNAAVEGHTTGTEISWLILHGLLHLLGLDHETDHGEMAALEHGLRVRLGVDGEGRRSKKSRAGGARRSRRGLKPGLGAPEA